MRNILLLMLISCLLSGCLGDIVLGGGEATPRPQREPARDGEGKEIKMWVPKDGMIPSKVWESRARVEEEKCSNAYYIGKNVASLFPSQKGVYKILPRYGNRIWAYYYYYYYGEDTPGFDTTDWYETVFNIYADANGRIYGCAYAKYPLGWVEKHGTTGGVIAPYP